MGYIKMAKIIFVSKWKCNRTNIYEAYYESDRWYRFYGDDDVPKTVRKFMDNAIKVDSIWNKDKNRREIVYKEN